MSEENCAGGDDDYAGSYLNFFKNIFVHLEFAEKHFLWLL